MLRYAVLLLVLLLPVLRSAAGAEVGLADNSFFLKDDVDGQLNFYLQQAATARVNESAPRLWAQTALLLAEHLPTAGLSNPQAGVDGLQKYLALPAAQQDPLARDVAQCMLADLLYAQGDFAAGKALLQKRGTVPQWLIAGQFGRYDRASFYEQLPPEEERDLSAKMPGIGRETEWRLLPADSGLRHFNPWDWVSPRRGVVYLRTAFQLAKDAPVLIALQTQCAGEVWIDGKSVGTIDRLENEYAERQTLRSKDGKMLKAGWHSVLVKLYGFTDNREVTLRVTDAQGLPPTGLEFASTVEQVQAALDNPVPTDAVVNFTRNQDEVPLGDRMTAGDLALRAAYLQAAGKFDGALRFWRQATKDDPGNAGYWSRRGECERQCLFLPEPRRESLAYLSHQQAVKLNPACVPSLLALAEHEKRNRRFAVAAEYYDKALKANPAAVRVLAARARMAIDNGWMDESSRWLTELRKQHPLAQAGLVLEAERKDVSGGLYQSATALEKAYAADRGNQDLALEAVRFFASAGEQERAQKLLAQLPPESAALPEVLQARGQVLLHGNQPVAAAEAFATAAKAAGNDAQNLSSQGEAMLAAGNSEEALKLFKQSLKLAPDQHAVRRLVAELEKTDYAFWKPYERDPFEALKKFDKENKSMAGKTVRLIDQTILTIYPDGSYINYTHELQKVLNPGGVKEAAQIRVFGELLSARTIIPGRDVVLEPVILPGQDAITMPALSPGAAVDYSYLQSEDAPGDLNLNFPKWYFRSPDSEENFLFSQYIVRVTPGAPFSFAMRNMDRKMRFERKTEADGTQVFLWTGQDMPMAVHEEGSPGIDEALPFVAIASDRNWEGVNRLFLNYYTGRLFVDSAMREKVAALMSGISAAGPEGERLKAVAIYHFVCRNIEKAGTFAPASYVFDQKAGDRILLLLALLREAGLRADFAAARPAESILSQPVWDLPAAGIFTNFLARVELSGGGELWLDPALRFQQAGRLTEELAGGSAFVTGRDGGRFASLPAAQPADYTVRENRRYSLKGHDMLIEGSRIIPGIGGLVLKERLEGTGEAVRQNIAEEVLAAGLPGLEMEKFSLPGVEGNTTPFRLDYTAVLPGAVRGREDDMQGLPLGLSALPLLPEEDNTVQRRSAYHLARFVAEDCVYELKLPSEARQMELPDPVLLRTEFGYYQLCCERKGETVTIRRSCHFPPQRIALGSWNAFVALTKRIGEAESALVWWK